MHKSNRHLALAIVGWLALCGAQSGSERGGNNEGPQKASSAPRFKAYAGYNPDPCYKVQDHDAADLCAQWRAAVAAEKAAHEARRAVDWSIVATILSGVALLGIAITIIQGRTGLDRAREANRIAQKANARATRQAINGAADTKAALEIAAQNAAAAQRQVEITQDTAQRQLRAYIVPEQARYTITDEGVCEFFLVYSNTGQTPATNLHSICGIFLEKSLPESGGPAPNPGFKTGTTTVGARAKFDNHGIWETALTDADLSDLSTGNKSFYLFGFVEYEDIFGRIHNTNVSFVNNMPVDGTFKPWGRWNTIT